jgi:hypothetical protein
MRRWTHSSEREFELLAAGIRLLIEFRRELPREPWERDIEEQTAQRLERLMEERSLQNLRASYNEVRGVAVTSKWGSEFLDEFQRRYGVSFLDIRGQRGPAARLAKILQRNAIETPADLRCAQDRLDQISGRPGFEKETKDLERMIDAYSNSDRQ